jgi:hypothetical protein
MNRVKPYLDNGKMNDDGGASNDIGSVLVGAGSTAGRAVAFTYATGEKFPSSVAFLPVGQRPSIGISGLTLGGRFGFLTRFAGLLCDRLKSLTAIVPTTPKGRPQNITEDNEYSDLFWASCGGGGGNFAVLTDFEFNAVQIWCDPSNTKPGCNVLQIEMILPASVDVVTSYFKNGVELNPGVTEDDKDYWVDRFREIRAKYNPLGMMVNTQGVGLIDADVQIESIESGVDVVSYLPVFSYLPLFFITYT